MRQHRFDRRGVPDQKFGDASRSALLRVSGRIRTSAFQIRSAAVSVIA
jgi:hypothetical protein